MSDEFNTTVLAMLGAVQDSQVSLHRLVEGRLTGIEAELESVRREFKAELVSVRTAIMERLDRLQHRMDIFEQHLALGVGQTDQVEDRFEAVLKENRHMGEQMRSVTKLLRMLEGRIVAIEDRL